MKINKLPKDCKRDDESIIELNIADNIKKARMSVGLSQKELALMIGFKSATALSLIEDGKRGITTGKLWLISQATDNYFHDFLFKNLIP